MGCKMNILYSVSILMACISQTQSQFFANFCDNKMTCTKCVSNSQFFVKCHWNSLTQKCQWDLHVFTSTEKHELTDISQCPPPARSAKPSPDMAYNYNSSLGAEMAKWSSLAYVSPYKTSVKDMQKLVEQEINPNYEIAKVVTGDCDANFDYGPCSALVAVSLLQKRIVVAFSGTNQLAQLIDQIMAGLRDMLKLFIGWAGMVDFEPTGGKVLGYNKKAHDNIYPCVQQIVTELLRVHNHTFGVVITGHSFGGAQAKLTAAQLIFEKVVPQSSLQLYTFGSPRVGSREFAFNYNKLVKYSWRVVNQKDPVPLIVPKRFMFMPFAYHTKNEILYEEQKFTPDSNYTLCKGNEDVSCTLKSSKCWLLPNSDCHSYHGDYFLPGIEQFMSNKANITETLSTTGREDCLRENAIQEDASNGKEEYTSNGEKFTAEAREPSQQKLKIKCKCRIIES